MEGKSQPGALQEEDSESLGWERGERAGGGSLSEGQEQCSSGTQQTAPPWSYPWDRPCVSWGH